MEYLAENGWEGDVGEDDWDESDGASSRSGDAVTVEKGPR